MTAPQPLLVGLSGLSSSGKTTIARLVRRILPSVTIIHEDDFYRPEADLPRRGELLDWDSAGAIDVPAFAAALHYAKLHSGALPPGLESKEDRNDSSGGAPGGGGDSLFSDAEVDEVRSRTEREWGQQRQRRIVLVDGFLLFGRNVAMLRDALDVKLLLRSTYALSKQRREARQGYVTLEGFWADPEGYWDDVVWPGYVEEHDFLFVNKDVEGRVDEAVTTQLGIQVCPGKGDWSVKETLNWVLDRIKASL